jgi:polyvinyl alcohol dehydrogenase (cytochrome)
MSDSLLAIDYATGQIEWQRQFTEGDVYVIFEDPPSGPDADVGAAPNLFTIGDRDVVGVGDKAGVYSVLDRSNGDTVWATMLTEGSHLGGVMTTAAVDGAAIYLASNIWEPGFDFGNPDNVSVIFALDAETGNGDVVYHGTIDGRVHAVSSIDGSELWSELPGGDVGGGFTVVNGTLLAGHGFWFFTDPGMPTGGLVAYRLPEI